MNVGIICVAFGIAILIVFVACAELEPDARRATERSWQNDPESWKRYCEHAGQIEVRLHDGTRVDYLTDTQAIEIDWSDKWCEAIGQSLYYAAMTDRDPAIILLRRGRSADIHIRRCAYVCQKHGISMWSETP